MFNIQSQVHIDGHRIKLRYRIWFSKESLFILQLDYVHNMSGILTKRDGFLLPFTFHLEIKHKYAAFICQALLSMSKRFVGAFLTKRIYQHFVRLLEFQIIG